MSSNKEFLLSIVVPVFNEEANINALFSRLKPALQPFNYEIVMVNDGSTDNSLSVIMELMKTESSIKLINLTRNFGHEAATTAGVDNTKGDAVVVIDADLQDPPELIPEMINLWKEGYEVVYAQRESREGETWIKKASSKLFYKFMSKLSDIPIPQNTGDYRLMDRKVVDDFKRIKEKNRFFRGLVCWVGYNQIGIMFKREKRHSGKTKYNYFKLLKLSLDSVTSFSSKPLFFITVLGFAISLFSFLLAVFFIFIKIILKFPVSGWTSLIVTLLFINGFQVFLIGLVGEYIARMFIEVKDRPLYLIKEIIDNSRI